MSVTMSLTREQMLTEMDQALADEITKQNRSNPGHHTATDGKLVTDGNGQYIYIFTLDEPWDPQDDAQLRIANASGGEIKCSVVNARGTLITITSDKPLPEELLQRIDFIDDSTELLRRQREALKEVQEGEGHLASKSFDLLPYRTTIASVERQLSTRTTLRDQQHLAASKALGGEITFIVGPPGTGKTLTLAAIAFTHLREGRTVLIAAHTNIAIDNAIMKLCDLCQEARRDDLLAQGQAVRFGAVQKAELKDDPKYQEVYLPKIVQRLNAQLQQEYSKYMQAFNILKQRVGDLLQQRQTEIQRCQQQMEQFQVRCEQLRNTLQPLEVQKRQRQAELSALVAHYRSELQQFEHTWITTSQRLAQMKAFIVEQSSAYTKAKQQEQDSLQWLLDARVMNGIQRFLRRINLEKLEQQVGETTYQANHHLLSVQAAQRDEMLYQREMSVQSQHRQYCQREFEILDQQLNTPSAQAVNIARLQSELTQEQQRCRQQEIALDQAKQLHQSELQELSKQQQQWEVLLAALDQQMRDIEKKIVENACVVGTTLSKTYMNQVVSNCRFDAVIIDEVSMAPMPLIYLAANHAERSVTFIGDPQQLAPIVNANTELAQKWLGKDLFQLRGVSLEAACQEFHHSVLLDVQSRMHPQIARIANTLIYKNQLRDDFNESKTQRISPLPDAPLVLCNTQDAAPMVSRPPNGRSRRNYYHALCCLELAKKVRQQLPGTAKISTPVIGIITPYAPQARLIQKMIKEARLQDFVQAGTVHRFQGLEFDTVIFDTVESPGLMPGDFISGSIGSNSMRIINVAITRARHKLFIVAHQQHILQTFPETAIMKQVVQYAAQSSTCLSLDIIGTSLATILQKAQMQLILPERVLNRALQEEEILVLQPIKKTEKEEISQYNEKTFYDACKRDIYTASQSITIASPFLALTRVKKLLSLLLEKQQQGIKMTIYTKPLKESKDWHREAAQFLLDAGLQLTYRSEMHQKAIIIDEKVLYYGSLNMLSQRNTGESMLRILKKPQLIATLNEELQAPIREPMTEDEIQKLKTIAVSIQLLPDLASTCACGSHFIPRLRKDGSGAFYGCENYSRCSYKNTVNITKDHLLQIQILQNKSCAHCNSAFEFEIQYKPQRILFSCENQCEEKQRIVFTQ